MINDKDDAIDEIFSATGALSQCIENFSPREGQIAMARAIATCIKHKEALCVEAGTGTGKTFAYLLPALLSKKKVIVSTGTKNLQDQLFFKDLPLVIKATDIRPKIALLKGRANYVCLYRLDLAFETGRFNDKSSVADLQSITHWSHATISGDIAEVEGVSEDASVWPWVTSNEGNCLGAECPLFQKCYVVKARRKAQAADLVVINHHLFFADLALRDREVGEILPDADVIIFDEAHQVAETASNFFDERMSSRSLIDLCDDLETESQKVARDIQLNLHAVATKLRQATQDLRLALGQDSRRDTWASVKSSVSRIVDHVKLSLLGFNEVLESAADLSEGLNHCFERSIEAISSFEAITADQGDESIHWFETYPRSFVLHVTPLLVAKEFQAYLDKTKAAKIFTSATLTSNGDFSYFQDQLNLQEAGILSVESPFDFKEQALLYVPRYLPMPSAENYTEKLLEEVIPLLNKTNGRAFILFTSHYALSYAANFLRDRLEFPLFIQGELPKTRLLEGFAESGNGVLLGTSSFWEGVDIRGSNLSMVIIDKLPFASPYDPIMRARLEMFKKQGKNAFFTYQLPKAVLSLKQGVGRLIRDIDDKGLLVVCDPRLIAKAYGETFIESLPPLPRTRDAGVASDFAEEL